MIGSNESAGVALPPAVESRLDSQSVETPDERVATGLGRMLRILSGELEGEIRTDDLSRAIYSTDASMYRMLPLAVIIPRTIRDVERTVEAASLCSVPILARGGASSLAGQAVAHAVIIDFTTHLNRIIEINKEERWASVEAGVILDDLNAAVKPLGLMVGPDPASSNRATMAGMVANNSTGTHSICFGNVIHHIRSVDAVLADGSPVTFSSSSPEQWNREIEEGGSLGEIYSKLEGLVDDNASVILRDTPGHWRRNSGYRLESLLEAPYFGATATMSEGGKSGRPAGNGGAAQVGTHSLGSKSSSDTDAKMLDGAKPDGSRNVAQLLCGSEGTLAVITRLKIGLVERPTHTGLGVVHFETRSQALRSVTAILETDPSAIELFDGVSLEQFRAAPGLGETIDFVEGTPGGLLLTEYYGESDEDIKAKLKRLSDCVDRLPFGYAVVERTRDEDIATVWSVRKEALGLIMGVRGDAKPTPFIEDAAVPVEHLAEYIDRRDAFLVKTETRVVYYAHASGDCLHVGLHRYEAVRRDRKVCVP